MNICITYETKIIPFYCMGIAKRFTALCAEANKYRKKRVAHFFADR